MLIEEKNYLSDVLNIFIYDSMDVNDKIKYDKESTVSRIYTDNIFGDKNIYSYSDIDIKSGSVENIIVGADKIYKNLNNEIVMTKSPCYMDNISLDYLCFGSVDLSYSYYRKNMLNNGLQNLFSYDYFATKNEALEMLNDLLHVEDPYESFGVSSEFQIDVPFELKSIVSRNISDIYLDENRFLVYNNINPVIYKTWLMDIIYFIHETLLLIQLDEFVIVGKFNSGVNILKYKSKFDISPKNIPDIDIKLTHVIERFKTILYYNYMPQMWIKVSITEFYTILNIVTLHNEMRFIKLLHNFKNPYIDCIDYRFTALEKEKKIKEEISQKVVDDIH